MWGWGGISECGDLISPQQDLGSTLGFSQHNYRGRETEKEFELGQRLEGETFPNNPFLMKPLLPSLNTKFFISFYILLYNLSSLSALAVLARYQRGTLPKIPKGD